MDELFNSFPFWAAWALFFTVGMLRGQGTYWLARFVSKQSARISRPAPRWQRVLQWAESDAVARGKALVRRVGVFAVPLCYLTVGLQTVVLVAAGLAGIAWVVFTAVQVPGVAVWATIYSTVGFVAWRSAAAAMAGQWWPLALFLMVAAVAIAFRRQQSAKPHPAVSHVQGENS